MQLNEDVLAKIVIAILAAYVLGLVLLSFGAASSIGGGLRIFATAIVVGAAVAVASGVLGFIFGMPRAFSGAGSAPDIAGSTAINTSGSADKKGAQSGAGAKAAEPNGRGQGTSGSWANDNLVEVSDWLTKIVVGIGLVQLGNIIGWIADVGALIGQGAGLTQVWLGQSVGVAVILVNAGVGFLVTYVFSRTLLTLMFAVAHRQTEQQLLARINEVEQEGLKSTKNIREALFEASQDIGGSGKVLMLLYQDPPDGFERAISEARELLQDPSYAENAKLWSYLACGLGQKFAYAKQRNEDESKLASLANEAHEAIEKAVRLDPTLRRWFREIWDPNDPAFVKDDNDLQALYDDAAQRKRFADLLAA